MGQTESRARERPLVVIKGGGDVASACAHALVRAGVPAVIVEEPEPKVTRRRMAFASAVYEGEITIQGLRGVRVNDPEEAREIALQVKEVPVLVDADGRGVRSLGPDILIDGRMRKRARTDTRLDEAPLVIGLGPGFRARVHAHLVIETNRGPNLGRVIEEGEAEPYTGIPQEIGGYARERYAYAPCDGLFRTSLTIGAVVRPGDVLGTVAGVEVRAGAPGMIRGLLRDGLRVGAGQKLADIDPREEPARAAEFTDRAVGVARTVRALVLERGTGS